MNSFKLNCKKSDQTFDCLSHDSEFTLVKVVLESSFKYSISDLQKMLTGFYFQLGEVYSVNNEIIKSRFRPLELSKEIDLTHNSIHFNQTILNEEFYIDGIKTFYNQLNVKLINRYDTFGDLNVEVFYDGHDILRVI